jgi:hypothetical protein
MIFWVWLLSRLAGSSATHMLIGDIASQNRLSAA